MQVKLMNLTNIIAGYTFRGAVETDKNGNAFVLQAKNIIPGEAVTNNENLTKILFDGSRGAYFLQNNDVVVVSRGTGVGSYRSAVWKSDAENILASASLFIVRITDNKLLPEYLSLYFNSPLGQGQLFKIVSGAFIQTIPRSKLEELNIFIPPLQEQQQIIDLAENIRQQQQIIQRQTQIKQKILNASFINSPK
jgi:restriction endonuclease S subunit